MCLEVVSLVIMMENKHNLANVKTQILAGLFRPPSNARTAWSGRAAVSCLQGIVIFRRGSICDLDEQVVRESRVWSVFSFVIVKKTSWFFTRQADSSHCFEAVLPKLYQIAGFNEPWC